VANATNQYTMFMAAAIPFVFLYEIFKRVLQGQNIIVPIVIAFAIANAINFGISYTLLYYTNMGYTGCAVAFSFLYASGAWLLHYKPLNKLVKVKEIKHLDDNSWSWDSIWKLMPTFMSLSFHGWAMFVFELAGVSIASFLAGGLQDATVAITATSIYMGFRMIFSMPYLGFGIAASIRVGNALGAHQPMRAKSAAWKTLVMSVSWGILSGIAMLTFGSSYAEIYTNDAVVLQLVSHLLWATAPLQITMAIWNIVQGVFRGSGTE
ncbi:Multidrug/Oligosaccharidyl-lipid/Polysaccharide (MOP) Flippase Superfamily, partial [Thraustotheca clavata]